jgi:nucleotide-binding universal stress UspA family protein
MYSDLLLPTLTYPDATPDRAIRSGVSLAKRIGGDLTLLTVKVDLPRFDNVLANALLRLDEAGAQEEARSAAAAQLEAVCARIAAEEAGEPIRCSSLTAAPYLEADVVALRARTHDMTLIPVGCAVPATQGLAEAVLFGSGRPILIYSDAEEVAPGGGVQTVTIAWDGSARAARAVADALPILRTARRVVVFVALGEKPQVIPGLAADLIRHLGSHGVSASLEEHVTGDASIGETLGQHVRGVQADLLVMGGFGHSRAREFVLGGATRAILQAPPCPVLMSH